MKPEEKRRNEIEDRIAEMRYAAARLEPGGDRRSRYLAQELDELTREASEAAAAWGRVLDDLADLRNLLPAAQDKGNRPS